MMDGRVASGLVKDAMLAMFLSLRAVWLTFSRWSCAGQIVWNYSLRPAHSVSFDTRYVALQVVRRAR